MKKLNKTAYHFTTSQKREWDEIMGLGLLNDCKQRMGHPEDFPSHSLYVSSGSTFCGGILFEHHGAILWIETLWVDPSFRGRGLGKQLLEKTFHFVQHHQIKEIQLNTYFKEAYSFFLKMGFEEVALIPNWKWGLDCYLMRKQI